MNPVIVWSIAGVALALILFGDKIFNGLWSHVTSGGTTTGQQAITAEITLADFLANGKADPSYKLVVAGLKTLEPPA